MSNNNARIRLMRIPGINCPNKYVSENKNRINGKTILCKKAICPSIIEMSSLYLCLATK